MHTMLLKWLSIADRQSKMYLDRLLAPIGINSSQYMYITVICRNPGITQEQFTEMIRLNPSNITRALNSLIQAGFFTKEISSGDKRKNCLYPTPKAYEADTQIKKALFTADHALLDGLSPDETELFLKVLQKTAEKAIALNTMEGEVPNETDTKLTESSGV